MQTYTCDDCRTQFTAKVETGYTGDVFHKATRPEVCLYCRKNRIEASRAEQDDQYKPSFVLTPAILEHCVNIDTDE